MNVEINFAALFNNLPLVFASDRVLLLARR